MDITVVRGRATPEELEAIVAALAQRLTRPATPERALWSDPAHQVRRPLPAADRDGWRLGTWA